MEVLLFLFVLCSYFCLISADLLFTQGFYDYSVLPGVQDGTEPNYPFRTETNRGSDGISSTSAFSTTSPRFPNYHGSEANVSDRYRHYTDYAADAAKQGVALFGAGDAEKEAAKVKLLNRLSTLSQIQVNMSRPVKNFTVYAAIKWNPSDFAIQEGEYYQVAVNGVGTGYGSQMWNDGGLRVDADGYSSYFDAVSNCYVGLGRCRPHLKKRRRIPDANWMSLGCAIGEFVRQLTEVEPGQEDAYRWMPLDESQLTATLFNVGKSVEFRADHSGQLICFANDAQTSYWNNYGQLQVTVTRTSWPPTKGLVYEKTRLPSCDSAQVVYVNHGKNTGGPGKLQCNIDGGGSGWSDDTINSLSGSYGSGAPGWVYADLPAAALSDNSLPLNEQ
jgi:hypothetical protein